MLASKKELLNCSPPFLMKLVTGEWSLVVKISNLNNMINLLIVQSENNGFMQRNFVIPEPPFYVGADVWELEYGSVLMTLKHPSLNNHPAKILWEKWVLYKREV